MTNTTRRDVFQAIADPTRREIIHLIAREPMNLNSIAEQFDISRPAVSQHIKILIECGIVIVQQQGRERYCKAQLKKLSEVSEWVNQYKRFWNDQFDSLDQYLKKTIKKK